MRAIRDIIDGRRRELLIIWAIFAIWIFTQYRYIYAHQNDPPLNFQLAVNLSLGFIQYMLLPWIVTICLALWGYIVGRASITFIIKDVSFHSRLEETVYFISIGLGFIAIGTFLIGLAELLYPALFLCLALLSFSLGFKHLRHLISVIKSGLKPLEWDFLDSVLFLLMASMTVTVMFLTCNPSTGYDALNSHLAAPKFYLKDHAVNFFPWINFNNFPQVQEMLLTIEMMILPDPGVSIIFLYMLGIPVTIYIIGQRFFNRKIGLIGALIFLLIEHVWRLSMEAYVEHLLGFYVILMIHSFICWYQNRDSKWLVLIGIIAGLTCGVKYTAMLNVLLILLLIPAAYLFPPNESKEASNPGINKQLSQSPVSSNKKLKPNDYRKKNQGSVNNAESAGKSTASDLIRSARPGIWKSVCIVLLWTIIVASPWYIRNLVLFGNPFFPFYESIFSGFQFGTLQNIRSELTVDHVEMLKYFRIKPTLGYLLSFPWNFTFHDNSPWYDVPYTGTVGPLFLALTPSVLFIKKWRRITILLTCYLALYYAYWLLIEKQEDQRYMMNVYSVHCLLAAHGLSDLFHLNSYRNRSLLHFIWIIIIAIIAFGMFYGTIFKTLPTFYAVFTKERRIESMRAKIPEMYIIEKVNESISKGSEYFNEDTIIYGLCAENRRFFFDCPLIGGLFGYSNHFDLMKNASSGKDLYDWLCKYNCDYLLFSDRTKAYDYALHIELPNDPTFSEYFELIARTSEYGPYVAYLYNIIKPGRPRILKPGQEFMQLGDKQQPASQTDHSTMLSR